MATVWLYWNTASGTSSTTADTWSNWNDDSTTCTSAGTDYVWGRWITTYDSNTVTYVAPSKAERFFPRPKTTEQARAEKAQRELERVWRDMRIEEERKRKEAAELTAQALLEDLIGKEQLEEYRKTGNIVVHGRKHDYVLRAGSGVIRVEKDKVVSLCVHLKEQFKYPEADNTIAVLLQLRADERKFNKMLIGHETQVNDTKKKEEYLKLVSKAA